MCPLEEAALRKSLVPKVAIADENIPTNVGSAVFEVFGTARHSIQVAAESVDGRRSCSGASSIPTREYSLLEVCVQDGYARQNRPRY
jgi:hypothetical protein